MKTCSFHGCVKDAFCKGLCIAHYQQQRLGKALKPLQQQFHGLSEKERLMKWISKQPNGCWRWMGSIKTNKNRLQKEWHGQWRNAAGVNELSHRAAWRILVGEIPRDALVLHRCDNPRCCNPEHLFLGTTADNVADMWDKGRARPGLVQGAAHGCAKLTEDQVREIRKSSEMAKDIASRLGVSRTQIYDIRKRRSWAHIE